MAFIPGEVMPLLEILVQVLHVYPGDIEGLLGIRDHGQHIGKTFGMLTNQLAVNLLHEVIHRGQLTLRQLILQPLELRESE